MGTELTITAEQVEAYRRFLAEQERSCGTVEQYIRAVKSLAAHLGERTVSAETLQSWKGQLLERCAIATVNAMIAAVNGFLAFWEHPELKLKSLRCQQRLFREAELTPEDYRALLWQAEREGDQQTMMLLKTMLGCGVRVSELRFLTVESAKARMAVIHLKGKVRQIPLGEGLCRELLRFAKSEGIVSGAIFLGRRGKALDRRRVWERLKSLCAGAGVAAEKVHPHALRHLFARMFYEMTRDIVKLADILGHSSINTTRIYTATSPEEHRALLDRLSRAINEKKPPQKGGSAGKGQNLHFVRLHRRKDR